SFLWPFGHHLRRQSPGLCSWIGCVGSNRTRRSFKSRRCLWKVLARATSTDGWHTGGTWQRLDDRVGSGPGSSTGTKRAHTSPPYFHREFRRKKHDPSPPSPKHCNKRLNFIFGKHTGHFGPSPIPLTPFR